ncbi:MAG: Tex-like N-terminal domain-containing protein, partial [Olleya sp.]
MLLNYIISKTKLPETSVKNTIDLLNQDATIPFISRYRKEATGNLDEVQIGDIVKYKEEFEALEKRKIAILKALEEQDVLTDALQDKVTACTDLTTLEDLYLPYKKSRKTKAETARKNGLEPLAKIIMSQNANDVESIAFKYVKGDVKTVDDALEGARHIIAEWINERTDIRNNLRNQLERHAMISTKVVKTKKEDENAQKFRDYFEWEEALSRIPSHRLLAILRAEKEGFIRVKIEIDKIKALENIDR